MHESNASGAGKVPEAIDAVKRVRLNATKYPGGESCGNQPIIKWVENGPTVAPCSVRAELPRRIPFLEGGPPGARAPPPGCCASAPAPTPSTCNQAKNCTLSLLDVTYVNVNEKTL